MSRRIYDHVHKYKKVPYGKGVIYRCAVPRCTHFVYPALLYGRESVCWKCGKAFVINRNNTSVYPSYMTEKPVCCGGSYNPVVDEQSVEDILSERDR